MPPETIGQRLNQGWTFTRPCAFNCFLGDRPYRQNIHAIHLIARHPKNTGFLVDFALGGRPLMGHPDRPVIILNHKQNRQLPQRRHIQALEKLTVIASAIAKKTSRYLVGIGVAHRFFAVFRLKRRPRRHRNAFSNKRIAAQQTMGRRKHVHRTAATFRTTSRLTK